MALKVNIFHDFKKNSNYNQIEYIYVYFMTFINRIIIHYLDIVNKVS